MQAQTMPVATPRLTRQALAEALVKVLALPRETVSSFPMFRDVPLNHSAYQAIEITRMRQLTLSVSPGGYYHPEAPVTHQEALRTLAKLLPREQLSQESVLEWMKHIGLSPQTVPPAMAEPLIRLVLSNIITPEQAARFSPTATLSEAGFLAVLTKVATEPEPRRTLRRLLLLRLRAGLPVTMSPATSIFKERLKVGDTLYFTLTQPLTQIPFRTLPKGSAIRAVVATAQPNDNRYQLQLDEISSPDGDLRFRIVATLNLQFRRDRFAAQVIVPGDEFTLETQPLAK
ncbi:MAG: hypothetical protein SFZ03_04355 [Candidatus Melainabacteria bacterium]|nr:hypothetical protein [Candidatus Melainabacteria bacterium]